MDTISITTKRIIPIEFFITSPLKWTLIKNKNNKIIAFLDIYNIHIEYFEEHSTLKMRFSATKLIYGTNCKTFDFKDLNIMFSFLRNVIKSIFNFPLQDVTEWNITRLDLVTNIYFKNIKDKKIFIELLKKLTYSRCKKDLYSSSIHAHNKSNTFNLYDKNEEIQNNSDDKSSYDFNIPNTLRLEIQFKNSALYRISKKYCVPKTLGVFMSSPSFLNKIYKDTLRKIGLDKKFLTEKEMSKLLKKLYKNKEISKRTFDNMYNYFINKSINISKNTLLNYKKILSNYNCSHILLDRKVNKKINFMALLLFKATNIFLSFKKKFKNLHWVLINIILYLIINFKTVIKIYDDS